MNERCKVEEVMRFMRKYSVLVTKTWMIRLTGPEFKRSFLTMDNQKFPSFREVKMTPDSPSVKMTGSEWS